MCVLLALLLCSVIQRLHGVGFTAMRTQCARSAHAVRTQCTRSAHAVQTLCLGVVVLSGGLSQLQQCSPTRMVPL